MRIDFGKTTSDYVNHRVQFAPRLFERLRSMGVGLPSQRILDQGAGTGLFGAALASKGCNVTLADVSADLLKQSTLPRRVQATADALPFVDKSFHAVTAAQCWHWFDRLRAPREILRVLRDGGPLAVVYQTYIPLPGSVAEASEKLILRHRPSWRHANSTGLNGQVLRDVQSAGFVNIESFSFDIDVEFTHETWRGFIRTTSPIGASMSSQQLEWFDREHGQMLREWPAELTIPHRVFAAVARKPI